MTTYYEPGSKRTNLLTALPPEHFFSRVLRGCLSILAGVFLWSAFLWSAMPQPAAAGSRARDNTAQAGNEAALRNYFTDVSLINQNGQPMRVYSDLLKDKVVIINSFFTSCTSVCPMMARSITKIQDRLGDRLGKDVHIISISVDPETDTPPRLKEFADKFNARPGWYFLTGKKADVEFTLRKLGQYVEAKDDHTTVIIMGNVRTGLWKKVMGMAAPEELIKAAESVLNDKGDDAK